MEASIAFGSLILRGPKDCKKKPSNNGNGRWQLIVGFLEVSLLLLLPKVAT